MTDHWDLVERTPPSQEAEQRTRVLPRNITCRPTTVETEVQRRRATAPSSQNPPKLQRSQAVRPLLPWNEPAVHASHLAELALGATVPDAHGVDRTVPSEHECPGGHTWQPS